MVIASKYYVPDLHSDVFPLLRTDFPIQGTTARLLKEETQADSPLTTDDFGLQGDELDKDCKALDPIPIPIPRIPFGSNFMVWSSCSMIADRTGIPASISPGPNYGKITPWSILPMPSRMNSPIHSRWP